MAKKQRAGEIFDWLDKMMGSSDNQLADKLLKMATDTPGYLTDYVDYNNARVEQLNLRSQMVVIALGRAVSTLQEK